MDDTSKSRYVIEMFFIGATNHPVDNKRNALALRIAKAEGCYDEVLSEIRRRRAVRLQETIRSQRHWQTNVSRRPQRGRHHDSWSIREKYVRCSP